MWLVRLEICGCERNAWVCFFCGKLVEKNFEKFIVVYLRGKMEKMKGEKKSWSETRSRKRRKFNGRIAVISDRHFLRLQSFLLLFSSWSFFFGHSFHPFSVRPPSAAQLHPCLGSHQHRKRQSVLSIWNNGKLLFKILERGKEALGGRDWNFLLLLATAQTSAL